MSRLYERRLPSGGYVAIEAEPVRTLFGPTKIRGHLVVERRPESRRAGHQPPIAACSENHDERSIFQALLPLARSDNDIAAVLARKVMIPVNTKKKWELS